MCDTWSDANEMAPLLSDTVSCKKAAIVTVFFTYLMYVIFTGAIYFIEYKWPEEKRELAQKLRRFKLDIEQKQFYIMALALIIQIQAPTAFPVVMLFLYLFTYPVLLVGYLRSDKKLIKLIAFAVQIGFQFILIFFVLINPWCRYYYFRYIVSVPSDSYYAASYTQPTAAPTNSPSDNSSTDSNSTSGNL